MADEVVVKSGRFLPVGDSRWEIADRGGPVGFVDLVTEARQANGIVYLSFAAGVVDAANEPYADVFSRIRMHLGTAQFLHKMLGDMIDDALKPVDQSKAN